MTSKQLQKAIQRLYRRALSAGLTQTEVDKTMQMELTSLASEETV